MATTGAEFRLPSPQLFCRDARAFGHRFEFRPGNLRIADSRSEAAVGAGHHVLTANDPGITHQAFGDDFRVLDDVGGMADDAGDDHFALRKFHIFPNTPLVLVARVGGLDRVGVGLHLENDIDDVTERNVELMRPMIAAPAGMKANFLWRNVSQAMIEGLDAQFRVLGDIQAPTSAT